MAQAHYYGDNVRSLLITGSVVMVLTMPFYSDLIPRLLFFSILAVLILVLLSGMISPRHKAVVIISTIVSAGAFIAFQYYAVTAYQALGMKSGFFLVNEFLALVFLTATYFGTKSVRGLIQVEGL